MKRAFTLVNTLLGLCVTLLLIHLVGAVLRLMIHIQSPQIHQVDVFALQLTQSYYRSNNHRCIDGVLYLDDFELIFDRERIVKRPGYEIYLEDVESFEVNCSSVFELKYRVNGKEYTLEFEKP